MRGGPRLGTRCTICQRPDVAEIDKSASAGTVSNRQLAQTYGTDRQSLGRHIKNHLFGSKTKAEKLKAQSASLVAIEQEAASSFERKTFNKPEDVLDSLNDLYYQHYALYSKARAVNDMRMMSKCLAECGVICEKMGKAYGIFQSDGQVVVNLQTAIVERRLTDVVDSLSEDQLRAYIQAASNPEQRRKMQEHVDIFSGRHLPPIESETNDDNR